MRIQVQKANLMPSLGEMEPRSVLWVGSPLQENITFSLKGKMLVDFCLFTLYLLLKLHLFTYQCLRNPLIGMLFL